MRYYTPSGGYRIRQKMSLEAVTNGFSQEQDCVLGVKRPTLKRQTRIWIRFLAILFWFVVLIGFPLLILFLRMYTR
jgi:hypothetical protein